jgi:anthranilate/para-aminobenzoate synthase component I
MSAGTVDLRVVRSAAAQAHVDEMLARLDDEAGVYFGVDAGIPGLHPPQATLLAKPALALRLYGNGLDVEALSAFGEALLDQPALAAWRASAVRGPGVSTLAILRGFMACFALSPDVLLIGALPFAAHRLGGAGGDVDLGVLFFGERLLRRDSAGAWHEVAISLSGVPLKERRDSRENQDRRARAAVPASPSPGDDYPVGGYAGMVRRALTWLRDKPLVSLTLSQSYRRRVALSPAQAFRRLREANPAPASFFLNDGAGQRLFGASPDLQLVIAGGELQALPVCGTVARRPGAVGEAQSLRELMNEEVDAASLAVCTDALRNDLAPLCEPGSLRLLDRRRPMSLATVVHAVDRLCGRLRPDADAWDAIVATAAPVMVTGTPRAQALEAIDHLEASPRGWYGGMVVQVASNGEALAGTILRAAVVRGGVAEVRTGGDLMADSSPEREEQESRVKTLSLWRAFGLEAAAITQAAPGQSFLLPRAIRLIDADDPFGGAMRDCLLGLGLDISPQAATAVVIGSPLPADAQADGWVAVGDAALILLREAGCAVQRIDPEHGRLALCTSTAGAPWQGGATFLAARYASFKLADTALPAGWQAWALDEQGQPMALADPVARRVYLLFRPDSLLSDPQALQVLRAALAFAALGRNASPDGPISR